MFTYVTEHQSHGKSSVLSIHYFGYQKSTRLCIICTEKYCLTLKRIETVLQIVVHPCSNKTINEFAKLTTD